MYVIPVRDPVTSKAESLWPNPASVAPHKITCMAGNQRTRFKQMWAAVDLGRTRLIIWLPDIRCVFPGEWVFSVHYCSL